MKVLVVRLSSFGDVVHTFPALTDLRAARPDVKVDWLVDESFAAIARLHPAIDEVIPFAERRDRWPPSHWPAYAKARWQLRGLLRARRYDLVVDLQGLVKSAVVARLANAPVTGYDPNSIREPLASRLYNRRISVAKTLHAVERNRKLLAAAIEYDFGETAGAFGITIDNRQGVADLAQPYCVLFHSASWPSKLWSERKWSRLVSHLASRRFNVALPWGNDEEKGRAERIAAGNSQTYVLGHRLEGAGLAAMIGRAHCAVGLDSGLMHLSSALGVPGVWLFGPTDPGLTGPYAAKQVVVQSTNPYAPCRTRDCTHGPDDHNCMDLVDLERVATAVDELSAIAAPSSSGND